MYKRKVSRSNALDFLQWENEQNRMYRCRSDKLHTRSDRIRLAYEELLLETLAKELAATHVEICIDADSHNFEHLLYTFSLEIAITAGNLID